MTSERMDERYGTAPLSIMWRLRALSLAILAASIVGCSDSHPSKNPGEKACIEPENPYAEGTGHYAGYEWAEENGGDCNGRSDSFNEGCEEHHSQEDEYDECEARKK